MAFSETTDLNRPVQGHPPPQAAGRPSDTGNRALPDWRHLHNGARIPLPDGYLDQPYFIRADDGELVLVCTNCHTSEGRPGQHVVAIRSKDDGDSWSEPVALEPSDGVEASYAVILKTGYGRIYVFYNHNTDNVRKVPCDTDASADGWCRRVDSLGHFVFKYSDDHGRSWSEQRREVPVREFQIDRENTSGGRIRYFWNVGKAFRMGGMGFVPLHKVGSFGVNFFTRSEGALIRIPNLDTETDPDKLVFETLPDGDIGIRAPEGAGPIGEEHSFVPLSDGSIFTVFRTVAGYPACAYSRDSGHSWSTPSALTYPDGRKVKNPRAANFIWRLSGGRYLYWFHNHGGKSYADRNPVWCLAAREVVGEEGRLLEFSQPEILLYTDDITCRMSYPDCMELQGGDLLLTETEKRTARMHRIPAAFVERVCDQWQHPPVPDAADLLLEWRRDAAGGGAVSLPVQLPVMFDREGGWEVISGKDLRAGFSVNLQLGADAEPGVLVDNRNSRGRGFCAFLEEDRTIRIILSDNRAESHWKFSIPLAADRPHFFTIVIDGGPKTISGIFDGLFDDGGARQFGFGLFHPFLQSGNGSSEMRIACSVQQASVYNRALLTAEAVALFNQTPILTP
jgi:hypothetical protein